VNPIAWSRLLEQKPLPAAIVDLDAFDRNISRIRERTEKSGKKLRIASKSVRVPQLLKRILEKGGTSFQGLLTYSVRESAWLHRHGFRDLVVAYPAFQESDLEAAAPVLREDPHAITFMVDLPAHLEFLAAQARRLGLDTPLDICIDIDMSYRPLGVHLGVRRSSLLDLASLDAMLGAIARQPRVRLRGLMGYEAQIAGLGDANPFAPLLNPAKKIIKRLSVRDVARKRDAVAKLLQQKKQRIEFFNGGGSGSLDSTLNENCITEGTAGSGFLQSHLFDYYAANRNEAALYVALRTTRAPAPGMIVCHGGGIIGSGEIGPEKALVPVFPAGLRLMGAEGCGEVQTPLLVPAGVTLRPGDPVLLRPAKAGEPLERFREVHLISNGEWLGTAPTYRGLNEEFQ